MRSTMDKGIQSRPYVHTCERICRRLLQFKSVICDSKLMTVERPGDWSAYGVSVRTEEASSA